MIMMALGPFRFSIDAALLRQFDRRLPARHADIDLIGRAPASQFLGPGRETVALPCCLYPHFLRGRGLAQLEGMRQQCMSGSPLMLAAGTGRVLGRWTIRDVLDLREHFMLDGAPLKVDIRIELARYVSAGGGLNVFNLFG